MDQPAIKYGGSFFSEHWYFEFPELKNDNIKFNPEMNGIIYGLVKKLNFIHEINIKFN